MMTAAVNAGTLTGEQVNEVVKALKKGQSVQIQGLTVKRTSRWEFAAHNPAVRGHARFGRLAEIVEDILHFQDWGTLPRSTPSRPW